jgi:hypothetical protein
MKRLILLIVALCVPTAAFPQAPDSVAAGALKRVAFLEGKWKGSGWVVLGPGKKETFNQTEDVKRVGSLITIEGTGTPTDAGKTGGAAVHRAFGVIFFDATEKKLKMHAYKDGKFVAADVSFMPGGSFFWGFDLPDGRGKVRYIIRLNESKQWHEIGEFSSDGGQTWRQNFEMTLDKV